MMPSPADLTYFIEVAQTQNLTRAAERIGISQPSLTLAIRRLEDSLGTQVLFRSKKGVTLTQSGRQLLAQARELLQQWEKVKSRTLASVNEVQGSYTIGCHPSVALYSLPQMMAGLLEEYPHLEIKLQHDLSRKIVEQVVQMQIDLGIVVNPVSHPDLVIRKICSDEVTLWKGKGHRKTQDVSSGQGVLICNADLLQSQSLLAKLKRSRIEFARVVESSSLEVIARLTCEGAGIGILPGRVAAQERTLQRLPSAPAFHDDICLVMRMEQRGVQAIQLMADRIQKGLV